MFSEQEWQNILNYDYKQFYKGDLEIIVDCSFNITTNNRNFSIRGFDPTSKINFHLFGERQEPLPKLDIEYYQPSEEEWKEFLKQQSEYYQKQRDE